MVPARDSNLTLQLVPFGPIRMLFDISQQHPGPVILLDHFCRCREFVAFYELMHLGAKATTDALGRPGTSACG